MAVTYEIRIEGLIDSRWAGWFNDLGIRYVNGTETILSGELSDQAALHGILAKIRDLGITLVSVSRLDANRPTGPA